MAKKKQKLVVIAKEHDKREKFHFTCLRCNVVVEVKASNMTKAEIAALSKHDEYHIKSGSFCEADHFDISNN